MAAAPVAILVMDLSGFSELMRREGPREARKVVQLFRDLAASATEAHAGTYIKHWADNFLSTFPTVGQAEGCAETVMALIPSCAGIGWSGELLFEPGDVWGVEVNAASKLGEDVAVAGQVLLTEAAQCR